jgi:exopolyphosphatase/pppGpp-phosphohydrolase
VTRVSVSLFLRPQGTDVDVIKCMRAADLAAVIHAVGVDCHHDYFHSLVLSFLSNANPPGDTQR